MLDSVKLKAYWRSENTEGLRYFLEKSVVFPTKVCYNVKISTKGITGFPHSEGENGVRKDRSVKTSKTKE